MSILVTPGDYLSSTAFGYQLEERNHEISALVLPRREEVDAMPKSECNTVMEEMMAYCEALKKSGHLLAVEQLGPVQMAMSERVRNGKVSMTDGPFAR